jgi:hypothetical protein
MPVLAAVLIIAVLAATGIVMVRARRQRQAVNEHAAAVLRRDWVQELRSS